MVRSIEIPEPLFEVDVKASWDREEDVDVYHCVVLVDGKFAVWEKTYRDASKEKVEDDVREEFLGEFAERVKHLLTLAVA